MTDMAPSLKRLTTVFNRRRPGDAVTAAPPADPLDRRQGTWLLVAAALTVAPHAGRDVAHFACLPASVLACKRPARRSAATWRIGFWFSGAANWFLNACT